MASTLLSEELSPQNSNWILTLESLLYPSLQGDSTCLLKTPHEADMLLLSLRQGLTTQLRLTRDPPVSVSGVLRWQVCVIMSTTEDDV